MGKWRSVDDLMKMMGLLGEHPGNPAARKIAQSHLPGAMELEQTARTLREFPGNTPEEVAFRNKLIDRLMRFSKDEADESGIGFAAGKLPEYVSSNMKRSGRNPDRIMNDVDADQYKDLLSNDPIISRIEKSNPALAEKARRGDISISELRKYMEEESENLGFSSKGGYDDFDDTRSRMSKADKRAEDEALAKAKEAQRAAKAGIDRRMGQLSDELLNLENNKQYITPEQYEKLRKDLMKEFESLEKRRIQVKKDAVSRGTMDPDDVEGARVEGEHKTVDELDPDNPYGSDDPYQFALTQEERDQGFDVLTDAEVEQLREMTKQFKEMANAPYRNIRNMRKPTLREQLQGVDEQLKGSWDPRSPKKVKNWDQETNKRITMVELAKLGDRARQVQERSAQGGGVKPEGYDDGSLQLLMGLGMPILEAMDYMNPATAAFSSALGEAKEPLPGKRFVPVKPPRAY